MLPLSLVIAASLRVPFSTNATPRIRRLQCTLRVHDTRIHHVDLTRVVAGLAALLLASHVAVDRSVSNDPILSTILFGRIPVAGEVSALGQVASVMLVMLGVVATVPLPLLATRARGRR